jgi:hypothetical protein
MSVVKLANIGTGACMYCPRVEVGLNSRTLSDKGMVAKKSDKINEETARSSIRLKDVKDIRVE